MTFSKVGFFLLLQLFFQLHSVSSGGGLEVKAIHNIHKDPQRNLESTVSGGSVSHDRFRHSEYNVHGRLNVREQEHRRVSVVTVAWSTLAMAIATGLGSVPFFFVYLEPQWAGLCNGLAAGVMLAASFDLIKEGKINGDGGWVIIGILAGGIFIWSCKKYLEKHGEVSMLDIKGADANKVLLIIGIMTLHSFGEGSGVGVSFAGSNGISQGLLVTIAIAVHNIPEGLAVSMVLASRGVSPQKAMLWSVITSIPQPIVAIPSFLCAETFQKLLPFCTGFSAGCMIWMVIAEVLPDAFKFNKCFWFHGLIAFWAWPIVWWLFSGHVGSHFESSACLPLRYSIRNLISSRCMETYTVIGVLKNRLPYCLVTCGCWSHHLPCLDVIHLKAVSPQEGYSQ